MSDFNKIVNNIERGVEQLHAHHFEQGARWYPSAQKFCQQLAIDYNKNLRQVVGICSALSPMKEWELNKRMTEQFLIEQKCGTFPNQLDKSLKLLDLVINDLTPDKSDKYIMTILNGRKTQSFYHNIMYPDTSQYVTVDRHMMKLFPDHWSWVISDRKYRITEEAIQYVASNLKMIPCALQATLWVKFREK